MIRVTEGEQVRIVLTNNLPEATSIHWHGMPVPYEMDGMTPVAPGESFSYEFTAPAAGSYTILTHSGPRTGSFVLLDAPAGARIDESVAGEIRIVIDPPPVTAHAKPGCDASGLPNWSAATAVNCRAVPATADAVAGDTLIAVSVWVTVTLTDEDAVSPLESVIVAVSV
jgi:hypothetical protein